MSGRANKEWRPCPTRKVSAALTQISLSLESTRLCVSRATQGCLKHAAYPNCGTLEFTELLVALQRGIFLLGRRRILNQMSKPEPLLCMSLSWVLLVWLFVIRGSFTNLTWWLR